MERKLILNEDIFEDGEIVEQEVKEETLPLSGMLNQLIKSEWDAIDLYNSMVASAEGIEGSENIKEVLKEIVGEEYIHVGQLEKLLQDINPAANEIEAGKDEAEEQVDDSLEGEIK